MYKIKTYNKISKSGLEVFDEKYTIGDEVENADGAIVRSAALHDTEFPASLKAIARAGAGTNNIPIDRCSEQGIVVFNTPGANANAVKELVLAGLFLSSRRVVSGIEWAKTLKGNGAEVGKMVEKGKGAFGGPEIKGKKLSKKDYPYSLDEEGNLLVGSIAVCVKRAKEQAEEYGHSYERELHYLIVHGVMHCLGYDHEQEEDKAEMRQQEEFILNKLGITR